MDIQELNKIVEMNKAIAIFSEENEAFKSELPNKSAAYFLKVLNFHESWSLLMPVVEKISEIYNQADAKMLLKLTASNLQISYFDLMGPSREAVHQAVFQFIQWYNTQKPNINNG